MEKYIGMEVKVILKDDSFYCGVLMYDKNNKSIIIDKTKVIKLEDVRFIEILKS